MTAGWRANKNANDRNTVEDLCDEWRTAGYKIGFVPTMGALHEGHLSLVKAAQAHCHKTIVSIYVNPTQFGANEDLDRYPRQVEKDLDALGQAGVDAVFLPTTEEIYPAGFETYVVNPLREQLLCGQSRPTHFRGVLTVVLKFFNLIQPDIAVFGEKDFQQLTLIKRMVKDLGLRVNVLGSPLIREADGLAMSSRNLNLTPTERQIAPSIYRGLTKVREAFLSGMTSPAKLEEVFVTQINRESSLRLDYFELRDAASLEEYTGSADADVMALAAVYLGRVRLIDNLILR